MYTRPHDLDEAALRDCLAESWRFPASQLTYEPVGFGSHHWRALDTDGNARFVTVDDLDLKRVRTTDTTDDAFELLARTFTAVCALREEAGLEFVVAPLRAADDSVLRRLSDRYSVVVHPFIPARTAGPNGEFENDVDRSAVLRMVIAVHQARLGSSRTAVRDDGSIPHRDVLIDALDRGDRPWATGPYSERARLLLAAHAGDVRRLLDVYDRTVDEVLADDARMVMTHGEPHAANVMIGGDGRYHVVDWDTARLAPPERDLWDLDPGDGSVIDRYSTTTGVRVRSAALMLYRLWYDLAEIAGYVALFRDPHPESDDTAESWRNLEHFLRPRERWPSAFT